MAATTFAPTKDSKDYPFPILDYNLPIEDCYKGQQLVKSSTSNIPLNKDQINEIIKCSKSPIYFIENYLRIVSLDHGIIPFKLYQYQRDIIDLITNNRWALILLFRQAGKTQVMAAYLLWYALFHKNKDVLVLANKLDAAQEIMDRIRMMFENLPFFMQSGVYVYNKKTLKFKNGSKLFCSATSGSGPRGKAIALCYIDEACFIEQDMTFYESTYPVITSGKDSKIIMTSTPNGQRGMFYTLWKSAIAKNNDYITYKADWTKHPDRDKKWGEETLRNIGPSRFRQEFEVEFIGSSGTLISPDCLEKLQFLNPLRQSENGELFIYTEPEPNHKYIAITDPAGGVEQDYSICNIIDISKIPYEQVAIYRSNIIDPMILPYKIVPLAQKYNEALLLIECNNDVGGQVSYITYQEIEYENTLLTSIDDKGLQVKIGGLHAKPGIKTSSKVKGVGCANLKTLMETNKLLINDATTVEELGTFVSKKNSFAAQDDCHDDTTMTLVLFAWLVKQPYFVEYTSTDVNKDILHDKLSYLYDELLPIMAIANSQSDEESSSIVTNNTNPREGFVMYEGDMRGFNEWANDFNENHDNDMPIEDFESEIYKSLFQ